MTYVSGVTASRHDPDTVYAAFDNHKNGDFKPYLLKSSDRGRSWVSIAGDLPERDTVYTLVEDHVKPELLFVGTEFGAYFTVDGGQHWIKLKGGVPTIAVRDLDIQERENDLVLGTFGRSVYILDDYTPLRLVSEELLAGGPVLFPVKDAWRYVPSNRLGGESGKGWQASAHFAAPNPPFGAVFTYHLDKKITTRKERRREEQKQAREEGRQPEYPTIDELRAEDEEREPQVLLIVRDEDGQVIRRVPGPRDKGFHRVAWDLRYPPTDPVELQAGERSPWWSPPVGSLAAPGRYTVTLALQSQGEIEPLSEPRAFNVVPLDRATFKVEGHAQVLAFQRKVARLKRAVQGASRAAGEAGERLAALREALILTPASDPAALKQIDEMESRLRALTNKLQGDQTLRKWQEPAPLSIAERVNRISGSQWSNTSPPTQTQKDGYQYAATEFEGVLKDLRVLMEEDLPQLEKKLDADGAPWTTGRLPDWKME
jgi:hypothetical protein